MSRYSEWRKSWEEHPVSGRVLKPVFSFYDRTEGLGSQMSYAYQQSLRDIEFSQQRLVDANAKPIPKPVVMAIGAVAAVKEGVEWILTEPDGYHYPPSCIAGIVERQLDDASEQQVMTSADAGYTPGEHNGWDGRP